MDHAVRDETTRRFIAGLRKLEQDGNLDALADLFTEDAEVKSIDGHGPRTGPDGIRQLFGEYLEQFDRISTTFTQVTEGENHAALEWSSEATLPGGHPVAYTGITVIDLDGESVSGFRTCYDSAALLRPTAGTTSGSGGSGSAGTSSGSGGSGPAGGSGTSSEQDGSEHVESDAEVSEEDDENVGPYGADTGFIDEEDRDAAKGRTP